MKSQDHGFQKIQIEKNGHFIDFEFPFLAEKSGLIEKQTKNSENSINFTQQQKKKLKTHIYQAKKLTLTKIPIFAKNPKKKVFWGCFGQKQVKMLQKKFPTNFLQEIQI